MPVVDYRSTNLISPFQEVTRAHEAIALSELGPFSPLDEAVEAINSAGCAPPPPPEIEEEVVADIYALMKAMAKRTGQRLVKYQKKASKALDEAKQQYACKLNASKALVLMRKYSYYRLRVEYMAAARQELQSMIGIVVELKFPNNNSRQQEARGSSSIQEEDDNFDMHKFLLQLGHLQQVFGHIPVSTQENDELMQELLGALQQDQLLKLDHQGTIAEED